MKYLKDKNGDPIICHKIGCNEYATCWAKPYEPSCEKHRKELSKYHICVADLDGNIIAEYSSSSLKSLLAKLSDKL
ncbi:MAG: hypothetical protein SPL86_02240 [Succiniclasticum sp.]|uniref:hypothetical protein n=1 Tax=Succiniclasticum sp. TaxID=2775030 RepID=UPI002A913F92|nr:hypothetical protein [Succiniclasticum sp.]MDY6290285.1 hypothetical protein [Succiniclasticum sp.]